MQQLFLVKAYNNKNSRSTKLLKHKLMSSYTSSSQALKKRKRKKEEKKEILSKFLRPVGLEGNPGIEPASPTSAGGVFATKPPWKPIWSMGFTPSLPHWPEVTLWCVWQPTPVGVGRLWWKRQPTPVLLPGKSHGQRSLAGYSPWGSQKSRT